MYRLYLCHGDSAMETTKMNKNTILYTVALVAVFALSNWASYHAGSIDRGMSESMQRIQELSETMDAAEALHARLEKIKAKVQHAAAERKALQEAIAQWDRIERKVK
jgi:hypothetical protein